MFKIFDFFKKNGSPHSFVTENFVENVYEKISLNLQIVRKKAGKSAHFGRKDYLWSPCGS